MFPEFCYLGQARAARTKANVCGDKTKKGERGRRVADGPRLDLRREEKKTVFLVRDRGDRIIAGLFFFFQFLRVTQQVVSVCV